ncbi:hypothetical protein BJV78DRAFT_398649 [Lactifluus subvellereus]|nr:hypothetical protein BJV78DRAFT_398649 [Lactifluus subvellereus]
MFSHAEIHSHNLKSRAPLSYIHWQSYTARQSYCEHEPLSISHCSERHSGPRQRGAAAGWLVLAHSRRNQIRDRAFAITSTSHDAGGTASLSSAQLTHVHRTPDYFYGFIHPTHPSLTRNKHFVLATLQDILLVVFVAEFAPCTFFEVSTLVLRATSCMPQPFMEGVFLFYLCRFAWESRRLVAAL